MFKHYIPIPKGCLTLDLGNKCVLVDCAIWFVSNIYLISWIAQIRRTSRGISNNSWLFFQIENQCIIYKKTLPNSIGRQTHLLHTYCSSNHGGSMQGYREKTCCRYAKEVWVRTIFLGFLFIFPLTEKLLRAIIFLPISSVDHEQLTFYVRNSILISTICFQVKFDRFVDHKSCVKSA